MKKFFTKLLDFILARSLTEKHLERSNVRLRAAASGFMIATVLIISLLVGEHTRQGIFEFNGELFVGLFFGIAGIIWALHTAFDNEFVSKFQRLAALHDKLVSDDRGEKPNYIDRNYLCFADDCVHYRLHKNTAFAWTFDTVVMTIVNQSQNDSELRVLLTPYTNLKDYIFEKPAKYSKLKTRSVVHCQAVENYFKAWEKHNADYLTGTSKSNVPEKINSDGDEPLHIDPILEMKTQKVIADAENSNSSPPS